MSIGVCTFGDIAKVDLGVKTFLNGFFYLDAATITKFGIEKSSYEPVFRVKDSDKVSFQQKASSCEQQLFLCDQDVKKFVGTGAAAYINWGVKQEHKSKGDAPPVKWKDTPALTAVKKPWYQNRFLPPPTRIVLLKAFDDAFSPLVLDKPVRVDQRFNQVNPQPGVSEEVLIGLLCSTWFVMLCETYGATAMGQGALEVRTRVLRGLPVPDIRQLDVPTAAAWTKATKTLLKGVRIPAQQLSKSKPQRALDTIVLEALGHDPKRLDELYDDTVRMGEVRRRLSTGRGAIKRERFTGDLTQVADDVAAQLKVLLGGRRFPADFTPGGADTNTILLGGGPLKVHSELLLGQRHVVVATKGTTIYDAQLPSYQGDLVVRAIQLGQRTIPVPSDDGIADAAVADLTQLCNQLEAKFNELAADISSTHRTSLREQAEAKLNFPYTRAMQPVPPVYDDEF